jgi:hypothetical protein
MSEPIELNDTVKLADPSRRDDTRDGVNAPEDGSQSAMEPTPAKKEPKNWDTYVHLSNGDVVKANKKILGQIAENGNTYRSDGVEHPVIGTYPKEVEFKEPEVDDE